MIYIGIDDTDNHESRGTGQLARAIAASLADDFRVIGVTRHQLLVDPRVPYTSHNSSAAILIDNDGLVSDDLTALFARIKAQALADFQAGSDPGLCIATDESAIMAIPFGRRAQREIVTQLEARSLAAVNGVLLEGLGGTQDGVIGALAAVGLAASGEDGRYLLVGRSRELSGLQTIDTILECVADNIQTGDGIPVTQGLILSDKIRPARRGAQPVVVVEWQGEYWLPVKVG